MKMMKSANIISLCITVLICGFVIFSMSLSVYADALEDIRFVKINAKDQMAVIKTPAGNMTLVKAGDTIENIGKVTEISEGRVMMERKTDRGIETVIIRLENGKQTVERINKITENKPMLLVPGSGE